MLECAGRVDKIAGVDAHFLHYCRRGVGGGRVEMNVGDQWCLVTVGTQCGVYRGKVVGFTHSLGGESDNLASGVDYALGLGHRPLRVHRRGRSH